MVCSRQFVPVCQPLQPFIGNLQLEEFTDIKINGGCNAAALTSAVTETIPAVFSAISIEYCSMEKNRIIGNFK